MSRCYLRTNILDTRLETITSWEHSKLAMDCYNMLEYEMHPVRDDLLWSCDSFVPTLSALIPQIPFAFQKGEDPQGKHSANRLIQMWCVNICERWSSIGPTPPRQKRRAADLAALTGNWNESRPRNSAAVCSWKKLDKPICAIFFF